MAKYDGDNYNVGVSGSLPLISGGFWSVIDIFGKEVTPTPDIPFTQGTLNGGIMDIHNDYKSTEQTMSGIYAGKGGNRQNKGQRVSLLIS